MTSMWNAPLRTRWKGSRRRDADQARFLTPASLKWVIEHKAYTPWYLVRYYRLAKFKAANPHVVLRGMVFLGKNVEIHATPELARLEIGRWVHIGDGNAIRCHEGSLRIGDKVVFGKDNVVNTYLDIEIGASTLVADWCYICDFDHRTDDVTVPIKDQGIVKSPVRIGPDTWIAAKVTVLRETVVGRGCVLGAHAVVKGHVPDYGIAVGAPARVVRNRKADWEAGAEDRARYVAALEDIARKKAAGPDPTV
ncbi:acetyltransferase [Rhodococcus sp. Leaf7]|jgi:acetyltransferase-like isoleucine patch superfamily enzyme|uniref:acyltransferase n=1 Tax=unclassified Rhodococcus (in: high G+C Gram-positive bacteria) TaxID=192944 RepID=UPI0006F50212|nr:MULTISPECIES: acyltransferase [unclassified Rhodococcus (in: high G+C Gram-positive bacteria)]KQU02699.1 acetyltransferase [Rhodococcus sp. Leaf7]KQU38171.1 acetyltransferase [Rhodococcus sp. Leaf247]